MTPTMIAALLKHPSIRRLGYTADTLAKTEPGFVRALAAACGVAVESPPPTRAGLEALYAAQVERDREQATQPM